MSYRPLVHPFGNGPQIPRSGVLDMVSTQSIDAAAAALTQLTRLADDDSRRGGSSVARRRSLATGLDACAPFLLSTGGSPSPRASIFHARRACGVAIPARARAINEYAIRSDPIVVYPQLGRARTRSRAGKETTGTKAYLCDTDTTRLYIAHVGGEIEVIHEGDAGREICQWSGGQV